MNKGFPVKAEDRLKTICYLQFGGLPESELNTLKAILSSFNGTSVILDIDTASAIKRDCGQSDTAFTTNIHRLVKRGVIKKSGKTIIVHPIFKDLDQIDNLVIQFS